MDVMFPESVDNSRGYVNSAQVRDIALSAGEIAAFGGPVAGGIPSTPPCPHGLTCSVDQTLKAATLTWQAGSSSHGSSYTIRRNGSVVGEVPENTTTFSQSGLAPGVYLYEVSFTQRVESCTNLPLTCQAEVVGPNFFFEDFDRYRSDAELAAAGWEVHDENDPLESSTWTVTNPRRRQNPPTLNGRPTNGGFAISDSDAGGSETEQNVPGSGMSHDLWSPSFSTLGANVVALHMDVSAQLNNNGDAVFDVDVSTNGGGSWTNVFRRVSPARTIDPLPEFGVNPDGFFGRLDLDITTAAANQSSVRVRLRHFEPSWDWVGGGG
jgi:hypothetical protein